MGSKALTFTGGWIEETLCRLGRDYSRGFEGEVLVTDGKESYKQIKSLRTGWYESNNCLSISEKESCPSDYEIRRGYLEKINGKNQQDYCCEKRSSKSALSPTKAPAKSLRAH